MVDDQRDGLWQEINRINATILRLETKVESELKALAPRGWVHEILQPIQQSVTRMESSVGQLSEDARELFEAHKKMLTEQGERERKEWQERTPLGLVRKYAPVVTLLIGVVALFRVLGTLAEAWLNAHK